MVSSTKISTTPPLTYSIIVRNKQAKVFQRCPKELWNTWKKLVLYKLIENLTKYKIFKAKKNEWKIKDSELLTRNKTKYGRLLAWSFR